MTWLNEPSKWNAEGDSLSLTTDPKTDFWRKTHYGFIRDNGHFFYETVSGEFVVETEFEGNYHALYDQAGLMIRADETTWLKTGIEFVESVRYISAVVTRDYSDWSVVKLSAPIKSLRFCRAHRSFKSAVWRHHQMAPDSTFSFTSSASLSRSNSDCVFTAHLALSLNPETRNPGSGT